MYVLYTDGRFEYVPEEQYNVNPSADYTLSNGYIRDYNRTQNIADRGVNISSGYVCTIEVNLVIIGPCNMNIEIREDNDSNYYHILNQDFTRGIQFYHNSIPVYKNFPNGFSYVVRFNYMGNDITEDTYNAFIALSYDYSYLYINYL